MRSEAKRGHASFSRCGNSRVFISANLSCASALVMFVSTINPISEFSKNIFLITFMNDKFR